MRHVFEERPPIVFRDGGVFLAIATITIDKLTTTWNVPTELLAVFSRLVEGLSSANNVAARKTAEASGFSLQD